MKSKFSNILLFSILLSIISILVVVCGYIFEISTEMWFSAISIIISVLAIFLLQRYYQQKICLNTASFKKLLLDTFYIIIIASVINSLFLYLYLSFISPEEIEKMHIVIKESLYSGYSNILSDDQIEQSYEMSIKFITPFIIAVGGFLSSLFQGFLIDVISALINRNKQNNTEIEIVNDNDE